MTTITLDSDLLAVLVAASYLLVVAAFWFGAVMSDVMVKDSNQWPDWFLGVSIAGAILAVVSVLFVVIGTGMLIAEAVQIS